MPFYAVAHGRNPGVYRSWQDCEPQVTRFSCALFKKFNSEAEAWQFVTQHRQETTGLAIESTDFSSHSSSSSAAAASCSSLTSSVASQASQASFRHLAGYTLYADGAARGNPGLSGVGGVIYAPDGRQVCKIRRFISERATNNEAEYEAILCILHAAVELNIRAIVLCADSKLVIDQLSGYSGVNASHLVSYYKAAKQLLEKFASFQLAHIPREKNTEADALANEAIDAFSTYRAQGNSFTQAREKVASKYPTHYHGLCTSNQQRNTPCDDASSACAHSFPMSAPPSSSSSSFSSSSSSRSALSSAQRMPPESKNLRTSLPRNIPHTQAPVAASSPSSSPSFYSSSPNASSSKPPEICTKEIDAFGQRVSLTYCEHGYELCHSCCYDFRLPNRYALRDAFEAARSEDDDGDDDDDLEMMDLIDDENIPLTELLMRLGLRPLENF